MKRRWNEGRRKGRGEGKEEKEVMEGGFIMPSLLRNFMGRVNSQKQLEKCQL